MVRFQPARLELQSGIKVREKYDAKASGVTQLWGETNVDARLLALVTSTCECQLSSTAAL